jgi:TolB-like protein
VLGDDAKQSKYVKTLAKSGYRFVGVVEPIPAASSDRRRYRASSAPEVVVPPGLGAPGLQTRGIKASRRNYTIPLVVAVSLISVVATLILKSGLTTAGAGRRTSIAVMFLDNQSKTAELDWLREGLADMLVSGLSRSQAVSVVGREQLNLLLDRSGHKRDSSIDLKEALDIAGRAHLDHIVLGSFAKLGNTIRIDLRLHDASGGLVKTEGTDDRLA